MIPTDLDRSVGTGASYNIPFIVTATVAAALGGLLFGYDWVVIGGAKPFFERYFGLTDPALRGWANSCALIGCLFGALAAGGLSDRYGRKRMLMLAALLFAVTSVGNALAETFTVFVLFASWAGSRSASHRACLRCTSPRSRPRRCAGNSWQ
jgi:MFS family permease